MSWSLIYLTRLLKRGKKLCFPFLLRDVNDYSDFEGNVRMFDALRDEKQRFGKFAVIMPTRQNKSIPWNISPIKIRKVYVVNFVVPDFATRPPRAGR